MLVQPGADERAAALRRASGRDPPPAGAAGLEQSEGLEARESLAEDGARDAELLDELALGGELVAGAEPAVEDLRADRLRRHVDERAVPARGCRPGAQAAAASGVAAAHRPNATSRSMPAPETSLLVDLGHALLEDVGDLGHLGGGEDERRRERHVVRRRADEETAPPRRLLHGRPDRLRGRERPSRRRVDEVEAVEEASTAQLAGDRVAPGDRAQARLELRRRARGRCRARRAARCSGSRRGRRRRRRGWPRRCGPPGTARRRPRCPRTRCPTFSVSRTAESGAYPLVSPFPTQRMSGHTSGLLGREPGAEPSEAGHDLVEDQEHARSRRRARAARAGTRRRARARPPSASPARR